MTVDQPDFTRTVEYVTTVTSPTVDQPDFTETAFAVGGGGGGSTWGQVSEINPIVNYETHRDFFDGTPSGTIQLYEVTTTHGPGEVNIILVDTPPAPIWWQGIINSTVSYGSMSITPGGTALLNGGTAAFVIPVGAGAFLFSDGTNWWAMLGATP